MSAFTLTVTDAGRAALVNGDHTGLNPLRITQIAIGTGNYTPTPDRTSLTNEFKRITTFGGEHVGDGIIHVSVQDHSQETYSLNEFGLYTDSGILFAVFSTEDQTILEKNALGLVLITLDIIFTSIDPALISLPAPVFSNPPATTERAGVVEKATPTEVQNGEDNFRFVTAYTLRLCTASSERPGVSKIATLTQVFEGINGDSFVSPFTLAQLVATDSRRGIISLNELRDAVGSRLINVRVITANSTYTKPSYLDFAIIMGVGGGAAGGGTAPTNVGQQACGGGGAAGCFAEALLTTDKIPSTVPVTIGAAGIGVIGAAGTNGGTSSFGTLITLPGGTGGGLGSATSSSTNRAHGHGLSAGDPVITSDAKIICSFSGEHGGHGYLLSNGSASGYGASSPFGSGATGRVNTGASTGASGYGFGAGGGGALSAESMPAKAGGDGCRGIFIIFEYGRG